MAVNEVFRDADHLTLPVVANTISSDPVLVGSLPGVAQTDRDTDGNATVWRKGAFNLPVDAAVTVGAPVYIDADAKTTRTMTLTATATDNVLFGYALTATAAAGLATVAIAQV
jgi:predicted RecA/RadA family phage recombinase